jgi:hypothetical protein
LIDSKDTPANAERSGMNQEEHSATNLEDKSVTSPLVASTSSSAVSSSSSSLSDMMVVWYNHGVGTDERHTALKGKIHSLVDGHGQGSRVSGGRTKDRLPNARQTWTNGWVILLHWTVLRLLIDRTWACCDPDFESSAIPRAKPASFD